MTTMPALATLTALALAVIAAREETWSEDVPHT
jgi:hypothetical protein